MPTKRLINQNNQRIYERWASIKIEGGMPQTSLNQYKSGVVMLDDVLCSEEFDKLTVEILEQAIEGRPSKTNHICSFIKDCFVYELFYISEDVIRYLLKRDVKGGL